MPQMNPLLWINLFSYFIIILLIMNSFMYFLFKFNTTPSTNKNYPSYSDSWKW